MAHGSRRMERLVSVLSAMQWSLCYNSVTFAGWYKFGICQYGYGDDVSGCGVRHLLGLDYWSRTLQVFQRIDDHRESHKQWCSVDYKNDYETHFHCYEHNYDHDNAEARDKHLDQHKFIHDHHHTVNTYGTRECDRVCYYDHVGANDDYEKMPTLDILLSNLPTAPLRKHSRLSNALTGSL
ncbi:hypothetical protein AAVH_17379 [Aphelenchoides avenae]|nr:hypothetical protein AAVH_17379 [Aphelenchus avenae]